MPEVHFDEREDAEAFVAELADEGLPHRLHRDEFAGEDDFEDAAWLVEVDAAAGLSERAECAGGWLVEGCGPVVPTPAPLPGAPRRIK